MDNDKESICSLMSNTSSFSPLQHSSVDSFPNNIYATGGRVLCLSSPEDRGEDSSGIRERASGGGCGGRGVGRGRGANCVDDQNTGMDDRTASPAGSHNNQHRSDVLSSQTQINCNCGSSESSLSLSPVLVSSPTDSNTNTSPEKRSDLTIRAEMQSCKAKLIFSNAQLHKISKPTPTKPERSGNSSSSSGQPPKRKSGNIYAGSFALIGDTCFCNSCDNCHNWKPLSGQSQFVVEPSSCACSSTGSLTSCGNGHTTRATSHPISCLHNSCDSPVIQLHVPSCHSHYGAVSCGFICPAAYDISVSPSQTCDPWLYDRIAVDLSSAFSRDSISFITNDSSSGGGGNDAPEAGVFNLATEVLSALQHQLDTNQSFTPQDSSQMRGILQNFHFTALLRAHDVIVSEFFGDDSMRCSPVVEANSSTDPLSASPMPLIFSSGGTCTRSAAKGTSTAIETTSSSKKQHWGDNTHHHHQQTTVFCGREALEHHRSNSDTHMTSNGDCNRAAADHLSSCGAAAPGAGGGTALATVDNSNLTLPSSSPGLAPKSNITRVKLLNFHRNPGEPLGIILKILKTDHVVVSRIMIGGMIHRQKILSEGDEILEINGQSIRKHFSEDALRSLLNEISGDIVIKVKSNNTGATNTEPSSDCFFVRAMFDYRPEEDTTCQAAAAFGLAFQARDILQILKQKLPPEQQQYNLDKLGSSRQSLSSSVAPEELTAAAVPHHLNTAASLASITESQRWWQAQVVCRASETTELNAHYNDDLNRIFSNPASSKRKVGLVPSCLWRMEMIKNEKMSASKIRSSCGLFKKKKKVNMIELSEDEIYERVVHMTDPVPRKSLLLVGAPGVGRRSIKNALIQMDQRFAYPKPHTNKPRCVPDENCGEEEGGVVSGGGSSFLYHHVPHQELIGAANRGEYLELGKYNEYFFGTKYDTIDRIIASHLIPVLDIEPDSIKKLRNAKYMPYVVFVDAPRCFENAPTDDASIVQSFEQLLSVSGEIDRHYRALFDMTVVNSNIEQTVNIIRSAFDLVSTSTNHWLPLNWVQSEHCCNTSTTSAAINSRTSSLQRRHSKMSLPNS